MQKPYIIMLIFLPGNTSLFDSMIIGSEMTDNERVVMCFLKENG